MIGGAPSGPARFMQSGHRSAHCRGRVHVPSWHEMAAQDGAKCPQDGGDLRYQMVNEDDQAPAFTTEL